MSKKIAPTLRRLLEEPVKGVPMFAAYHGEVAAKELRALLAVARAAKQLHTDMALPDNMALGRALARLSRMSGGKP